ncbi:2563_t:CDS:2, partial [Acaulospora colombiana]
KYYSAKLALEKGLKTNESKAFLAKLLDILEQEKKSIGEMVTNDTAGEAYVENFGLKIFLNADNEDRAGKASKKTAKNFLAASIFLELLKIFGELNPENEEKIKYAKWKATDITKSLRDGKTPIPGPPGGDAKSQSPTTENFEGIHSSEIVPGIDQFPSAPFSNGLKIEPLPEDSQNPFPSFSSVQNPDFHQQPQPAFTPHPDSFPSVKDLSSSLDQIDSINQPIVPPLPPKISEFPSSTFDKFNQPPPVLSSFNSSMPTTQTFYDTPPGFNNNDLLHHQPPSVQTYSSQLPPNYGQNISPVTYQPPQISGSLPHGQQFRPHTHQRPQNYSEIDPSTVAQAQKHCKWVISALNYNDVKTAVENLHKVLAMLEPYNQ